MGNGGRRVRRGWQRAGWLSEPLWRPRRGSPGSRLLGWDQPSNFSELKLTNRGVNLNQSILWVDNVHHWFLDFGEPQNPLEGLLEQIAGS